MRKEIFFSKLKNKCPDGDEIERTKDFIKLFDIKNGELTKLYCKSDVILWADVFDKFVKVSTEEYGIYPLYCASLPGYTYQCALKYTDIKLQSLQEKAMILLLEKNIRGGISSVMGDRYVKSDEKKKLNIWILLIYTDIQGLKCCLLMKLNLRKICIEKFLSTPDYNDIRYFIEVDLKYPDNIKEKTKSFSILSWK